ncbi:Phosphatidylinositol transfer protein CSR1 [Linum grandiflorum]
MALRTYHHHFYRQPLISAVNFTKSPSRSFKFWARSCMPDSTQSRKLVLEVKEKLGKDHKSLPVGKCGRDDEEMILWFLKDRRFDVEETVGKLTKAIVSSCLLASNQFVFASWTTFHTNWLILGFEYMTRVIVVTEAFLIHSNQKWRQEFGVSELTEESVKSVAETGKASVHDFFDVNDRPVLLVVASNHFPGVHDPVEDQKLCALLIEKALGKLPPGKDEIMGIIDLRNFSTKNADLKFLTFLFDVFYYYYPKRLGEVLFVEAPFVFKPIWQLAKPLLKSYTSLVKFCSVETVRKEYFTEETVPSMFRD